MLPGAAVGLGLEGRACGARMVGQFWEDMSQALILGARRERGNPPCCMFKLLVECCPLVVYGLEPWYVHARPPG